MARLLSLLAAFGLMLTLFGGPAAAQAVPSTAPTSVVQSQPLAPLAAPAPPFDPVKATNAYLARIGGAAKANSDAYFEGKYWLLLVDTIWALGIAALLLFTRISASIRDIAERQTRSEFWRATLNSWI
jgi:STE24 endopeptidase